MPALGRYAGRRLRRAPVIALLFLLACASLALAGLAPAATSGEFTQRGVVTQVVDGDTVWVRLASGRNEKVRLIGIDAAERGTCYAAAATDRARRLALSQPVVLRGDRTQDTRDRYGRLLAYVWLPGGRDLGYQLLAGGFAKVYVFRDPFQRLAAYRSARAARRAPAPAAGRPADRARSARSCPRRRRRRAATRATRPACPSSVTSTAPTSARSASPPSASPAPIRTGSTATETASAATDGAVRANR